MPAHLRTAREEWIDAGLAALTQGGIDAVRVETIATALGVTKGGFYGHFSGRPDLLAAMVDRWEAELVDAAIRDADHGGGDGRARLRRLFTVTDEIEHEQAMELAMRDWARRDPEIAQRLAAVDQRRLDYLRPLFAEFCDDPRVVEARSLLVLTFFVGNALVTATAASRPRHSVVAAALELLLV